MKIDITRIKEQMEKSLRRFPVCLALLATLSLQLIWYIIVEKEPDAWTFFLSVGMLAALLLHLLTEDNSKLHYSQIAKNGKTALVWCIPFILLGIDSFFLHTSEITQAVDIAQSAAILALLLGICFLPFRKEKDDRMSWNFVLRIDVGACIAFLVGLVMFGGLTLLYYGSAELFGFEEEWKVVSVLAVLCLVTLSVLLFLIRIPEGEKMHCTSTPESKFLLGITRYLFIPLVMLYMLVLYVYGIKILLTWTLPKGMLSVLVSTLMFGIIGITFLLYPYLRDENHKGYEVWLIRLLPLFVLPLLVLMSVGIGRRFIDYGITDKRLYILTLNIWFYCVAIGLWYIKARRIHWVSISFATLLVLTSCHPWNYNNIYKNMLLGRIDKLTKTYNLKLKNIGNNELKFIFQKMPESDARKLYTTMEDIQHYDYHLRNQIFETTSGLYESYDDFMGINQKKRKDKPYATEYKYSGKFIAIPAGYKYMKPISTEGYENLHTDSIKQKGDYADYGIMCNDSTFIFCEYTFGKILVPHHNLLESKPVVISIPDHDAKFMLTSLSILDDEPNHKGMRFDLEGYVFYNK